MEFNSISSHNHQVCWCGGTPNLNKLEWVKEFMTLLKPTIGEEVEKAVQRALVSLPSNALSSGSRSTPHQVESSSPTRRLQLRFVGELPEDLLTMTHIQDEGASLRVELVDDTGSRVINGPESSVKIEILVLDGDFEVDDSDDDWTDKDFKDSIVLQREGKRPLLLGKCEIVLTNGVAEVRDIRFSDNSKWMRSGNFRLGAQVVKGLPSRVVVKPGVSNAFKVKEKRLQSHRKHKVPTLQDLVWRLDNIAKNGPICQRLANEQVHTLQDLLQMHHADEKRLKNILKVSEKKWVEIIRSAESCALSNEYYTFFDETTRVYLVLDCVFNIISVGFEGQSGQLYGTLDDFQKELAHRSRIHAYEKRSRLQIVYTPTNSIPTSIEPVSLPCNMSTQMPCFGANTVQKGNQLQNNHVSTHQMTVSVQGESMCPTSVADTSMQSFDTGVCDNLYEVQQTYGGTCRMSLEAQSAYPPDSVCPNTQFLDVTSANLGMQMHSAGMFNSVNQMDDQDTEIWISEFLNLEEETSNNESVIVSLRAACYATKAALKFMISVPPRKKRKVRSDMQGIGFCCR